MCKMVPTLSPIFSINSGVFFTGGATILLGTVIKFSPGATFFSLSLLGRIVQALGSTALFTLGYTIVANEFTERRATVLVKRIFFNKLKCWRFHVTVFPSWSDSECTMNHNEGEHWKIIFNQTFIVDLVNILTGFLSVCFNEATLEPHVRQLGLTPSVVGLLFIASGGIYAVGTPVWYLQHFVVGNHCSSSSWSWGGRQSNHRIQPLLESHCRFYWTIYRGHTSRSYGL
ncbi:MFS-type transporter SLC18B1-like [Tachypleus tridentatus]|uniref:MFS-type transporter SLC18B1-like n=1 Tax=Tachypleus tridentatus TaxID=6853 RepID=UPI003FD689FA